MLIDRAGRAIADIFSKLPDDAPVEDAPILVSAARYLADPLAFSRHPHPVGVAWPNDRDVSALASHLAGLAAIALDFPNFRDGRAYSQARQLRETHGYRGELRATGQVLQDQFQFMLRAGFDTAEIRKPHETSAFADAARRYSVVYQQTGDDASVSVWQMRRLRRIGNGAISLGERTASIAAALDQALGAATPAEIITESIRRIPKGRLAVVSSFGIESAVLLKLVADIDRSLPILFIDTGWLFESTLAYRDTLIEHLGLTDVRTIGPSASRVAAIDPAYDLWTRDADACCGLRKVEPLAEALRPFSAWITGRKRYQGGQRSSLPVVESDGAVLKFNPLAHASPKTVAAIFRSAGLPQHPLFARGYTSVGCVPCTTKPLAGESVRAGRWRGTPRTECGIHLGLPQRADAAVSS